MEMFGVVTPHGTAALRRVRLRGTQREVATEPKGLEAWTGLVIEKGVENLLHNFVDPQILDAARSIPEKDLSLREDSRRRLAAYVGATNAQSGPERFQRRSSARTSLGSS